MELEPRDNAKKKLINNENDTKQIMNCLNPILSTDQQNTAMTASSLDKVQLGNN